MTPAESPDADLGLAATGATLLESRGTPLAAGLRARRRVSADSAELDDWSSRSAALEELAASELRRAPGLEELRLWIEEYRVSLYAQELKTLVPISASRLEQREAEIRAWFAR